MLNLTLQCEMSLEKEKGKGKRIFLSQTVFLKLDSILIYDYFNKERI